MTYTIISGPHRINVTAAMGKWRRGDPPAWDDYYVIREEDGTEQVITVEEHERLLDAIREEQS